MASAHSGWVWPEHPLSSSHPPKPYRRQQGTNLPTSSTTKYLPIDTNRQSTISSPTYLPSCQHHQPSPEGAQGGGGGGIGAKRRENFPMHATRGSTDWPNAQSAVRDGCRLARRQQPSPAPAKRHRPPVLSSRPTTIPMTYHHAVLLLCLRAETRSMTMLWRTRSVYRVQTL